MDFVHSSETDVAYYILTLANKPIFYKELIMEVIEKKCKPVQFSVYGRRHVGTYGMEPAGNKTQHDCSDFQQHEQKQGYFQQTPYQTVGRHTGRY